MTKETLPLDLVRAVTRFGERLRARSAPLDRRAANRIGRLLAAVLARNPVRLHPGIVFAFTPESRSPCPGIPSVLKTLLGPWCTRPLSTTTRNCILASVSFRAVNSAVPWPRSSNGESGLALADVNVTLRTWPSN